MNTGINKQPVYLVEDWNDVLTSPNTGDQRRSGQLEYKQNSTDVTPHRRLLQ